MSLIQRRLILVGGLTATGLVFSGSNSNGDALGSSVRAVNAGKVFTKLVLRYKMVSRKPSEKRVEQMRKAHEYGAKIVLDLCKKQGGLFIKMAQFASQLNSVLPVEYTSALSVLRDQAPAKPFDSVLSTIEKELNAKAETVFEWIDPTPIGSASLAQVHLARLANDGREVAVKVQHAGLEKIVKRDLALVKWFDSQASWIFEQEGFSLSAALSNFDSIINEELNFLNEAKNSEKCRKLIEQDPNLNGRVWVPAIIDWNWVTSKLIVMEFVHGKKIRDVDEGNRGDLAQSVVDLWGAMIFKWGFVHGDCHLGNIMVATKESIEKSRSKVFKLKPGQNQALVLLDHGLYCQLDNNFRRANSELWAGMILRDLSMTEDACKKFGMNKDYAKRFTVYLTNRSISGSGELGDAVTDSERKQMREELGQKKMSMQSFNEVATDLPRDMVFVLKTMHLVRGLHLSLGGNDRDRFWTFGYNAFQGMCMDEPGIEYSWRDLLFKYPWVFIRLQNASLYAQFVSYYYSGAGNPDGSKKMFSMGSIFREETFGPPATATAAPVAK